MVGLRGGAPCIKLCWSWVPPGLQVAPAHMILPVTIIVYPPPNSLHEMLLSKWLHLISCYLTQDDTVFSIECLVIRFEWFLFFHLEESSSFTDHNGGLCVWKGVMFRYERVILDLTITNHSPYNRQKLVYRHFVVEWQNKKVKLWMRSWRNVSHCQVTLWKQLIAGSRKPLSPLKNHVQNLLKRTKHLTDFK